MFISSPKGRAAHSAAHQLAGTVADLATPVQRQVLSEHELAHRWGVNHKTLARWRHEGRGPKYLKLSKRVGYPVEAIVEFERAAVYSSTSQRAGQ